MKIISFMPLESSFEEYVLFIFLFFLNMKGDEISPGSYLL